MTKVLSLKIKGEIFEDVESITKVLHMPRNAYINEALNFYNEFNRRKGLRKKLMKESLLTRKNSMDILGEMERLEEKTAT
ncbi:MAG TPA: hypothetical protein VMV05_05665 [bacterium]|nr:hypothetical protein [bacterium]